MRDLSVVIPAYNEAKRIGETLESIAAFFDERDRDDELIVVDDGSTEDTIVKMSLPSFEKQPPVLTTPTTRPTAPKLAIVIPSFYTASTTLAGYLDKPLDGSITRHCRATTTIVVS